MPMINKILLYKVIFDSDFTSLTQSFMNLAEEFNVKLSFAQIENSILGIGERQNKSHAWTVNIS